MEDFKKCTDAAFCNRLLGARDEGYYIDPASVKVFGPAVNAKLLNKATGADFTLTLKAYKGFVRLLVDEDASRKRFEVPGVLMHDLESREGSWVMKAQTSESWQLRCGDAELQLRYSPLQIDISIKGQPVMSFNSRQMFNFEHKRQKQEGDPEGWWEETFKGHTDSKPRGPEGISFDLAFPGMQHVYGLPEHATTLSLKPTVDLADNITSEPYRLYNLDVFEYVADSPFGLYGSIPFLWAQKLGFTVGAFWLNAAEMFVDVGKTDAATFTNWVAESGILDLFLLLGPTPAKVSEQYAQITGTTALPQYFSLGYHQCRWNYRDEADVRQVDANFDKFDIPYDVIWLDIEHTDGKRYFTWDKNLFPDPVKLQEDVASHGRKVVTIIDPHIKRDPGYNIYQEAEQNHYFVRDKDGKDFDGWCWPGSSSYLDMLNPEVRSWWAQQFSLSKYKGSTPNLYVWNDMNEPSVFNGPEITMPKDNLHWGEVEHRNLHNLNGALFHQATAQGLVERGKAVFGSDGDRPFVLSRAFFAGTQRIGPIWTGDNSADWDHLRVSLPMIMSVGIAGLPFNGADVGGFFGNPDAELITRWNQVATFYPFFRGHAHLDTKRREPWLFGEDATRRIREAIRARYVLLPYIYTLFRHANTTGLPIMRPLWYEFPEVEATHGIDDEFLLGPALLVAPVLDAGAESRAVYLPGTGPWYSAKTGEVATPDSSGALSVPVTMDDVPSFLRGGHILPLRERARRSTAAAKHDPYTLLVALDSNGQAAGELYLDDGSSFAFQRGLYAHRLFTFKDGLLSSQELPGTPSRYSTDVAIERIVVVGLRQPASSFSVTEVGSVKVLQAGAGPVVLAEGVPESALVIRKPELPIAGDWSIRLAVTA
ncbi:g7359 [Coccomyxa elongata]